jgi:hypothetical protein
MDFTAAAVEKKKSFGCLKMRCLAGNKNIICYMVDFER